MRALVLIAVLLAPSLAHGDARRDAIAKKLVAALASKDVNTRRVAAEEIGEVVPEAVKAGAIPKLVNLAEKDPDVATREAALLALLQIGPDAAKQSQALLLELTDIRDTPPPGRIRGYALAGLGRMKVDPKKVTKIVIPFLAHPDDFTRAAAFDALVGLGADGVPAIVASWSLLDGSVRGELADALGEIGPEAAGAVPALLLATDDEDVRTAVSALGAVARIDPTEKSLEERAATILARATDRFARWRLLEFLGSRGAKAAAAAPIIEKLLDDPDVGSDAGEALLAIAPTPARRASAAKALAKDLGGGESWSAADRLAKLGDEGVAALRDALSDERVEARSAALSALARVPADKRPTAKIEQLLASDPDERVRAAAAGGARFDALVKALKGDASTRVRSAAAYALTGPRAVDPLVAALDDKDFGVRETVLYAIRQLGPDGVGAIPALLAPRDRPYDFQRADAMARMGSAAVPILRAALKDPKTQQLALDGLVELGPVSAPAVDDYARLLSSKDRETRMSAALGLMVIGPAALPALPDLVSALTDPEQALRSRAILAIGGIGPSAREALPDLRANLTDDLWGGDVLQAMVSVGGDAVVADLLKAAKSKDEHVRSMAFRGLEKLGVSTPAVTKLLRGALKDPDPAIRWHAAEALLVVGDPDDWLDAQLVLREAPDAAREKWQDLPLPEPPPPPDED